MNAMRWNRVRERLERKQVAATPAMRPRAEFWADFRARARMTPQTQAEEAPSRAWMPRWGYAVTAVAAMVLVAGLAVWFPSRKAPLNPIRSFEVVAPHTGVIIMEDQKDRGTILWVTGMNLNGTG